MGPYHPLTDFPSPSISLGRRYWQLPQSYFPVYLKLMPVPRPLILAAMAMPSVLKRDVNDSSTKTGMLFLVDLAGSEMVKKTHASGKVRL